MSGLSRIYFQINNSKSGDYRMSKKIRSTLLQENHCLLRACPLPLEKHIVP